MTGPGIVTRLALHYDIHKMVKEKDGARFPVECFFPSYAAGRALDALDEAPNLRVLRGVTHTPLVRNDGTILSTPGYDNSSGYLYLPTIEVLPVPPSPTRAQLGAATKLLRGIISEFTWVTDHDEANYLGLLLTPLLRLLCPPPYKLGAIMARQPGSGKSLLARILRDVHGGVFRSEMPHDDPELAKSITGILTCTTAPVVQFDNVSGTLRSSRLAGLLTSATYTDRVLGTTNNAEMLNDRIWTVTGNNLNFGGDLIRRTLWVTIDPRCPDPHLRTGFTLDLPNYVTERRGEILAALLTLVTAWHTAGMPAEKRSSDDYAHWSAAVRGILTHAGVPGEFDHSDSIQQKAGADDEGWDDFLIAIRRCFDTTTWTTRELLDQMRFGQPHASALIEALPAPLHEKWLRAHDLPGAIRHSLGRWLSNHNGRWAGRHVAERIGVDSSNATLWKVRKFVTDSDARSGAKQDHPEMPEMPEMNPVNIALETGDKTNKSDLVEERSIPAAPRNISGVSVSPGDLHDGQSLCVTRDNSTYTDTDGISDVCAAAIPINTHAAVTDSAAQTWDLQAPGYDS